MWTLILGLVGKLFGTAAATYSDVKKAQIAAAAEQAKSENAAVREIGLNTLTGLAHGDDLLAKQNTSWGMWSPIAIVTAWIAGIFAYHATGIVFDSTPFWFPFMAEAHSVGSWGVEKLPGKWEETEHVVVQSLFYGASTAVAGGALIRAIKR
jgi:hypothetical protein